MPRRSRFALSFALLCGLALVAVWVVSIYTGLGRRADLHVSVSSATHVYYHPGLSSALRGFATLCNPGPYAVLAAGVLTIALVLRGPRIALILFGVLAAPNLLTQFLKHALANDRMGNVHIARIDPACWPSGHATASLVLAGCAVIAAPAVLRPLVAGAGAVFALLIGIAVVGLGWHFPSDVLGGWAMAGLFLSIGYGVVRDEPVASAARLPQRFFGTVGAARENEQQV
jgi:membrane-associated phospholipid phosphatase